MIETRFKDSEVGRIPVEWEATKIDKLCSLKARIGWQGLTTGEYLPQGDYILITGTDFKDGYIDWKNCCYVSKWRYDQDTNIQIKEGDVLISKDGTIGKVAFLKSLPGPGTLNSGVFVVRPKQSTVVNQAYLSWLFKSVWFKSFIDQLTAGSTINHLYQKDFVKFRLVFPRDIYEQTRIASALSNIDSLISELGKLIEKKRAIKQGAMQQLLTGKKRLKGFTEPWVEKKLGEVCTITMGQSPSSVFYNSKCDGLPLIQGNADIDNRKSIIRFYTSQITKVCEKGDIIMSVRAPVGAVGKASYNSCLGRGVCALKNATDFLYHYLIYIENDWSKYSKGSTFDSINSDDLKDIILLLPLLREEQSAIASVLSAMDKEISALEAKREKYAAIKQGMMQQLLTGKIRLI